MRSADTRQGLTLLEVIVAASLLMAFLGMSLLLFMGFSGNMRDQMSRVDIESQLTRTEKLLRTELESVQASSIVLSDPFAAGRFTRIEYRSIVGFAAGAPVPSVLRRLDFVLDPGEIIDNASNDGDRFIDEGSLVLTVDFNNDNILSANESVVVATNVASSQEIYAGASAVGTDFAIQLGDRVAVPPATFVDQGSTGFVRIVLTFLGRTPNDATGVRLITKTWEYAIRN